MPYFVTHFRVLMGDSCVQHFGIEPMCLVILLEYCGVNFGGVNKLAKERLGLGLGILR